MHTVVGVKDGEETELSLWQKAKWKMEEEVVSIQVKARAGSLPSPHMFRTPVSIKGQIS